MTFIELVNEVLKRLRERSVSTVDQTTYSSMVGAFINDAKHTVESAWDWSANRVIEDITTVPGQSTYTLSGFGSSGEVLSAWNETAKGELVHKPQVWFDKRNFSGDVPEGSPQSFTFRGVDPSGDPKIELYPVPNKVDTLRFNIRKNQEELQSDSDELLVPWRPVVHLAVALLAEEKGEVGSTMNARYFAQAEIMLSDAIAYDASRNPTETYWRAV